MELNKLYGIAQREGVSVDRYRLPENVSVSAKCGDKLYVGIDNGVSGADEKVCLAHELGHCLTLSFYNIYSPLDIRGKHERKADNWAIKKLVPKTRYKNAIRSGYDSVYLLSEYFGVTADFMQKAIDYYQKAI